MDVRKGVAAPHRVLSPEQTRVFEELKVLLQDCQSLASECKDGAALQLLKDRLSSLRSAALFVVVGEVKAGKSSFVNALLGEEICKVAPDPCTAVIQELVFGPEGHSEQLGKQWERVALPKPVLKEISIVDTPGTNSIIKDHEAITRDYMPRCDLVIFVFPAKNPYTATAWDLLDYIRADWYRKVVFVLQQKDLANPQELAVNLEGLRKLARDRGIHDAKIYPVSATDELRHMPESGFNAFRTFLRQVTENGEVWRTKVDAVRSTAKRVASGLGKHLAGELAAINEDKNFYGSLLAKTDARRERMNDLKIMLVKNLCGVYDRLTNRLEQDFADGLSVGTVLWRSVPFLRDKDFQTWLRDLQVSFEQSSKIEVTAEAESASESIVSATKDLLRDMEESIARQQRSLKSDLNASASPERYEVLNGLLKRLQEIKVSDIINDAGLQGASVGDQALAGGGIALIGAVVAAITHLALLDITGGILIAVGSSVVVLTLFWKRASIQSELSQKLKRSREDFQDRVDRDISKVFETLFLEITHRIKEPFSSVEAKAQRITSLIGTVEQLEARAESISSVQGG
ncbi:MAG: hypothetical protein AMXMBFR7_51970 [Planctomycetota bacterium]